MRYYITRSFLVKDISSKRKSQGDPRDYVEVTGVLGVLPDLGQDDVQTHQGGLSVGHRATGFTTDLSQINNASVAVVEA